MIIEEGKFYFIKKGFFELFKDYNLMSDKENGTKRPCFFCFRDRKDKEIITIPQYFATQNPAPFAQGSL